jgi:hypothetical protein
MRFKNVHNYLNTNIYSYLETSVSKSYILYLIVVDFLTLVLIRHMWQLKTVVFLHWCLISTVVLQLTLLTNFFLSVCSVYIFNVYAYQ